MERNKKDNWDKAETIAIIITAIATVGSTVGTLWLAFVGVPGVSSQVKNITQKLENVPSTLCTNPIKLSCVCDYRNKNGYLNFKEQKCKNLKIGQSLNLTTEEVSQVSQYFILHLNSQITRFTITKNSNVNCTESGNCIYTESISETITVHG